MNSPNAQDMFRGIAKAARQALKSAPHKSSATRALPRRQQNPRETAQEAFHQVTPRVEIMGPMIRIPVADTPVTPVVLQKKKGFSLHAARGDDDIMSSAPGKVS